MIELKYGQSARGAIAQIKSRQYTEKLAAYQGNLLLVGINYSKADKTYYRNRSANPVIKIYGADAPFIVRCSASSDNFYSCSIEKAEK